MSLRFQTYKKYDTKNSQISKRDDELNKVAVWSSTNDTDKRLIFLKFDYRK